MILCPLWSLVQNKISYCIGQQCGMYNLCCPQEPKADKCPRGHDAVDEITSGDSKEREFICLECDERWTLPFGDEEQ